MDTEWIEQFITQHTYAPHGADVLNICRVAIHGVKLLTTGMRICMVGSSPLCGLRGWESEGLHSGLYPAHTHTIDVVWPWV